MRVDWCSLGLWVLACKLNPSCVLQSCGWTILTWWHTWCHIIVVIPSVPFHFCFSTIFAINCFLYTRIISFTSIAFNMLSYSYTINTHLSYFGSDTRMCVWYNEEMLDDSELLNTILWETKPETATSHVQGKSRYYLTKNLHILEQLWV